MVTDLRGFIIYRGGRGIKVNYIIIRDGIFVGWQRV